MLRRFARSSSSVSAELAGGCTPSPNSLTHEVVLDAKDREPPSPMVRRNVLDLDRAIFSPPRMTISFIARDMEKASSSSGPNSPVRSHRRGERFFFGGHRVAK